MKGTMSIEGPIELVNGALMLRIPLVAGGDQLAPIAPPEAEITKDELCITIPFWLAEKLRVSADSLVVIDNLEGKFRITRSSKNDIPNEKV